MSLRDVLRNEVTNRLPPSGIADVKRVQLHAKWRQFVPDDVADDICPKPDPEVIARVKQSSKEKREASKSKKQKNNGKVSK